MELMHYTNNDDLPSMVKKNNVNFRRLSVQIDQRLKTIMSDIDRIVNDINDRIDDINGAIDDISQRVDDLEPNEGEDNEQEG